MMKKESFDINDGVRPRNCSCSSFVALSRKEVPQI